MRSRDSFVSELDLKQDGVKYTFTQKIYRLPDHKLCNVGRFDCVCLDNGKLSRNAMLDEFVAKITSNK